MSDAVATAVANAPDNADSDASMHSNDYASACMQLPTPDSPESPPPDQQGQPVLPTHNSNINYPSDEAMDVLGAHTRPLNIAHENADSPPTTVAPGSPPAAGTADVSGANALGLSLMQSSPPPHSYRHSRAYRHFKNPPQPHMCIRTTTEAGEELFINVLSWTRIVIPQEPSDPIPLYGGMRVPPGSPRSPPIVFAVMANPEVLKDSGRHSKDPEERRAMVELMCDFVEAMNPGVKLVRNAVILKDRDISGELKDVWNAVQAQRDREREEQMLQQRQQQHCHNVTTQQMFPKTPENNRAATAQQKAPAEKTTADTTTRAETTEHGAATQPAALLEQNGQLPLEEQLANCVSPTHATAGSTHKGTEGNTNANANYDPVVSGINGNDVATLNNLQNGLGVDSNDQIDAMVKQLNRNELPTAANTATHNSNIICANNSHKSKIAHDNHAQNANQKANAASNDLAAIQSNSNASSSPAPNSQPPPAATPAPATPVATPVKKDKLGGFLPNGCIFPRFKNNKHKDKDKDKEKESKNKDKEKTLLNALKKSKEKKVTPLEQTEKTSPESDTKSQYEKNCINLESEVQKLDLNKIDAAANNDNMFIKLKVTATK